jgi:hypothetical protein
VAALNSEAPGHARDIGLTARARRIRALGHRHRQIRRRIRRP